MINKSGNINEYLGMRNDIGFIWHSSCFIVLLNEPLLSFSHEIERQASSLSSALVLPEPNSKNFSFRLSRFPIDGTETIVDIHSSGERIFISVTRFLKSIRRHILETKTGELDCDIKLGVEISISECNYNEPILREILNSNIFDLTSDLSESIDDNHFFIFFTDSHNCISSGISNPYEKQEEHWIRILNRSYGAELTPPRRTFKGISTLK